MAFWFIRAMRSTAWALGLTLVISAGTVSQAISSPQQQVGAGAVDLETMGPKVGDALPDFTLPDQHGQPRSLKSMIGANGAVVVFFRSADW
jgi:cytochrome oxidase Cu insertion factor (SCO1/SenC/PrrC family)